MILAVVLLATGACSANEEQTFAICFKTPAAGFQELELQNDVYNLLAGHPSIKVAPPHRSDSVMAESVRFGSDCYEPGLMIEMARAMGVRYIVWLGVEEAGIRHAEHTIIPHLFHSHHRKYVLAVRMFVLDSFSETTVLSEYFESKKKGPSALAYLDFDPREPGLTQKYSLVRVKFDEMEKEISEKVVRRIVKVASQR
jgi:hypothetical protein